MEPPALPALTPQQKYRKSEKCKLARERYYNNKGKAKSHEYYERNKEIILTRSKERYNALKAYQAEINQIE
jgi:hypothetical protein